MPPSTPADIVTASPAAEVEDLEAEAAAAHHSIKTPPVIEPYSIFTAREKWALVFLTSFASLFSPLSSSIYFPAIPLLAEDFGVSVSLMNLTVTVYLIFQGISPMILGPLADSRGRRPIYLVCLGLLCITCIALALVPTNRWYLLLIFRSLQSSGSASTVALGAGVVADVTTASERGMFYGIASLGALLGPSIGPVIGGLLAGSLGWRWIFWFLCIISGACFLSLLLFLPETLRLIVGNGSIQAPVWDRPLVPIIGPHRHKTNTHSSVTPDPQPSSNHGSGSNPFLFFLEPDVLLILFANSIIFALLSAIQASASLLLQRAHPSLTQTTIGLCFLPLGFGCIFGALVTGKQLNWQYAKERKKWETEMRQKREEMDTKVDADAPWTAEEELMFPKEKARVEWAFAYGIVASVAAIVYGWVLQAGTPLAVPLIFLFFAGFVVVAQITSFQTLLIDIFPGHGSATTAINNFVRCLLGAGVTAIINLILDAIGAGWTFVLFGGICAVCAPISTILVIKIGPRCRERRMRSGAFVVKR